MDLINRCARTARWVLSFLIVTSISLFPPISSLAAEQEVEEIIVTGSYIKRANQQDLGSPISIVGMEDISATGYVSLEQVTRNLTYNSGVIGTIDLRNNDGGGRRSSINLRGLGPSSTLVLLNGKRSVTTDTDLAGNDFVNVRTLVPLVAIDRLETVLDGASALYGSDAVAGVVNVITRDDFEGFEMRGQATRIPGGDEYGVSFIIGGGNERARGMLAFGWDHKGLLLNREREVTNVNNTSGTGSPGTYTIRARPMAAGGGDVIIDNGVHGPINYSELYDQAIAGTGPFINLGPQASLRVADPSCLPDVVPPVTKGDNTVPGGGQFSPTVDSQGNALPFPVGTCRFSFQPHNSIAPEDDTWSLYSHWEFDLNEYHTLGIDAGYTRQETRRGFIATFPMTNGTPVVPAENPFNPFGVDLAWTGRALGLGLSPAIVDADRTTTRLSVDLDGSLGWMDADWAQSWSWIFSLQYGEEQNGGEFPDTDLIAIQNALDGFGGPQCNIRFDGPSASEQPGVGNCVFFSPFATEIFTNDERTRFNTQTESMSKDERTLRVIDFVISGDVPIELGGGRIGLALGAQTRKEIRDLFDSNFRQTFRQGFVSPQTGGKGGRDVDAFFGEIALPLLDTLDVQLALRYEDYQQFDTTDPKVSVNFRAADWLTLRASAGTAFRAPGVAQVVGEDTSSFLTEIRDPADPAELVNGTFRTILNAKNPDLLPEESENYNLGFSLIPMENLQFDFDWWDYKFENQIFAEDPAALVRDDPFNDQVIRDSANIIPGCLISPPPGKVCGEIIIVNTSFFNAGRTETRGFDLSATFTWNWGANEFALRSETTYVDKYLIQPGPDADPIRAEGRRNGSNAGFPMPQTRSNLFINWFRGRHQANLTFRYVDSFFDDVFVPDGSIFGVGDVDDHLEVDVQYGYYFGANQQFQALIGAQNLFDEPPPVAGFTGFEPRVHDPIGQRLYFRFVASM